MEKKERERHRLRKLMILKGIMYLYQTFVSIYFNLFYICDNLLEKAFHFYYHLHRHCLHIRVETRTKPHHIMFSQSLIFHHHMGSSVALDGLSITKTPYLFLGK